MSSSNNVGITQSASSNATVEERPFWVAYDSRAAENACCVRDASPTVLPNPGKKGSPETKKALPKLNTTDVDCISVKMKSRPKGPKNNRSAHPRYRIQRVENKVAEDLQLTKFLESSDQACDESDCATSTLSDSFVSVPEPSYDIISDYGSMPEEKSAVGDLEWTFLDDINETFHVNEKDTDLVVLKSAKSYLLALTSNLGPNSPVQSKQAERPFKLRTFPATSVQMSSRANRQVKTATLHIQSSVPEEYYIRKCKPNNLHGRALKNRKGVN